MAKWEGTQNIPAEWLDLWRGNLTDKSPKKITRKRYPFRRRLWKEGGYKVTPKQKAQRERFKAIIAKFKQVDWATRQRWYAARPPWASLLWYYDYFILSGLMGNADINEGGCGVIKLIQHVKTTVPVGGGTFAIPTAIDHKKAVIMAWGGAHRHDEAESWAWAWICYPVPKILNSSQFEVDWSETPEAPGKASFTIIEYI
jgi:hypothetical protein